MYTNRRAAVRWICIERSLAIRLVFLRSECARGRALPEKAILPLVFFGRNLCLSVLIRGFLLPSFRFRLRYSAFYQRSATLKAGKKEAGQSGGFCVEETSLLIISGDGRSRGLQHQDLQAPCWRAQEQPHR